MRIRPVLLTIALASAGLGLTACGSDRAEQSATTSTAAGVTGTFNEADVTFLQAMIPHHEQAIEMAEIAIDPTSAATPPVVALAKRVQAGQDPEITQMKQWLTAWGQPTQMDTSDGHDMADMEGMMSDAQLQELGAATGAAFDTRWLELMIEHHEGAVAMAEAVRTDGEHPDVAALAGQIIEAQRAEIAEMNTLLER